MVVTNVTAYSNAHPCKTFSIQVWNYLFSFIVLSKSPKMTFDTLPIDIFLNTGWNCQKLPHFTYSQQVGVFYVKTLGFFLSYVGRKGLSLNILRCLQFQTAVQSPFSNRQRRVRWVALSTDITSCYVKRAPPDSECHLWILRSKVRVRTR